MSGLLGQWRLLVLRHRPSGPLASHVGPIDAELEAAGDQLDELRSLAAQCQAGDLGVRSVQSRSVVDRDPHRGGVYLRAGDTRPPASVRCSPIRLGMPSTSGSRAFRSGLILTPAR
jgi:hypothetical protein